jgi:hypothetical protein
MNHEKVDIVDVFTFYCTPDICERYSLNMSHRYSFFFLLESRTELFFNGLYSHVSDDTLTRVVHKERASLCDYVKSDKP